MKYTLYSYRFAKQIMEHKLYGGAFNNLLKIIEDCPLYIYPKKSSSNARLDVVQQLLNTYFDVRFTNDLNWSYHPPATKISNSGLAADFRCTLCPKTSDELTIQTEVQFGNAARWYSDIFKYQTAYSQGLIDIGLSIVPTSSLAARIDSNITNYERCERELPSAELSITLPVLTIGIFPDVNTVIYDVSQTGFKRNEIIGSNRLENRLRIVNNLVAGIPITQINKSSPIGRGIK